MLNFSRILNNKINLVLASVVALLLIGGFFGYQRFIASQTDQLPVEEVDLPFNPDGPYALLFPRNDGNALVLNIKRTGSYDSIKYELTYNSEGVDRGASGDINTKEKKGEYEQEILFGSCSTGGKCVFDKDVENGTLTLHIRKGREAYRIITQWHLQKPDLTLGNIVSGDNHFIYKINPSANLSLTKFVITNDLSGAPKLPDNKEVVGKVYGVNTPESKDLPTGTVTIELAQNPAEGSKIARFDQLNNKWVEFETKASGSTLTASSDAGGVFAVLAPKKAS